MEKIFDEAIIADIATTPTTLLHEPDGSPFEQQILTTDPQTGLHVERLLYRAGTFTPYHVHSCAHGIYVLSGKLRANGAIYGPGTMIWFPQGTRMEHGATDDSDAEVLFIWGGTSTNRPFDIEYMAE